MSRQTEPEEEAVNTNYDGDENRPPEDEVFPATIVCTLVGRQIQEAAVPNDAIDLLAWRRRRQQRRHDHHKHAEDPSNKCAVLIGLLVRRQPWNRIPDWWN